MFAFHNRVFVWQNIFRKKYFFFLSPHRHFRDRSVRKRNPFC